MPFYAYILWSEITKKHYVGHSNNTITRLKRHNKGLVKSTKSGLPWVILHKEVFETRAQAVLKEKQIKKRGASRYLNDIK